MNKERCYSEEELSRYWQEKISDEEKEEIEVHLHGKKTGDEHKWGKGCKECFKKLAGFASVGSKVLEHL